MKRHIGIGFILLLLAVSVFFGVAIIAAAGGALYPAIHKVVAPIVCEGKFVIESNRYSYKPGQAGIQHRIFCEDEGTATRKEITISTVFTSGFVYSGIVFVVLLVPAMILRLKLRRMLYSHGVSFDALGATIRRVQTVQKAEDISERLKKLQVLRDSGVITEMEYQAKRKEILSGI